jgi:hypothetical protein
LEIDSALRSYVVFASVEDMIADRLSQHESVPAGDSAMLQQARLLLLLADEIDAAYLRKRVGEECVDGRLVKLLGMDIA